MKNGKVSIWSVGRPVKRHWISSAATLVTPATVGKPVAGPGILSATRRYAIGIFLSATSVVFLNYTGNQKTVALVINVFRIPLIYKAGNQKAEALVINTC